MDCPKCKGMMMLERFSNFFVVFYAWKCINCGAHHRPHYFQQSPKKSGCPRGPGRCGALRSLSKRVGSLLLFSDCSWGNRPFRALYTGDSGWFLLAGQHKADGISRCARRRDASGRGLHEAGLCGAHRDRHGRGKLNRGGTTTACASAAITDCRYFLSTRSYTSHSPARFDPPADSPPSGLGSKETVSQIRDAPVGKVQGLHNERAAHPGPCESSEVCFLSLRDYTIAHTH